MDSRPPKCLVVADFNAANFAGYLRNESPSSGFEVETAPFGNVLPTLMQQETAPGQDRPDCAVVWTQPEATIRSFQRILDYEQVPLTQLAGGG